MKKIYCVLILILSGMAAVACPACEKQQPEILRGITHGAGPDSNWDYIIVSAIALIVMVTLYFSVKWILRPGERNSDHIKRTILNFE